MPESAEQVHAATGGLATPRLRLPLWDLGTVTAIRAGERRPEWHPQFPRRDDVDAATLWVDGDVWGPRSIVSLRSGLVMGSIGFFGAPEPAEDEAPEVEVGFGLVEAARGHGAATEALAAVLARADAAGVRVRARVRAHNHAAMRILTRQRFTGMRGTDEDGHLVLVRPQR